MIKKIAILFSLALIAMGVNAQLPVGGWTFHPPFNGVSFVTETKGMVFYLSGSSLFSVDKKTLETRSLNISNDLNGSKISNIFTQPEGNYIIVVYSDSNMDRINSDGSIVNISDIHDANINGKININHVGFGKGKFYVSTAFGLVTFDEKKNEARETMFTPIEVSSAYGLAHKVVISYNKKLMVADANKKLVSLDQFNFVGGNQTEYIFNEKGLPIGDNRLMLVTASTKSPIVVQFDFANDKIVYYNNPPIKDVVGVFNIGSDQGVAYNGTTVVVFNSVDNPNVPTTLTLPSAIQNHKISAYQGWEKSWAGNTSGLAEYDLSDFAAPVQLCDKFGDTDFVTIECCRVVTQPSGSLFFWNPYSEAAIQYGNFNTSSALKLSSFTSGDGFKDFTPSKQASGAAMGPINYSLWACQDPRNPSRYYISTWFNGVYIVEDNVVVGTINNTNSNLSKNSDYRASYIGFDKYDNLWIVQENTTGNPTSMHAISYDDLNSGTINKNMWKTYSDGRFFRSSVGVSLAKSDMMAFTYGFWGECLNLVKLNGTASLNDDVYLSVDKFIDQDNKYFDYLFLNALAEDANGHLWVGTMNGVFEIVDPSKVNSETAVINHIKVPRNDGTGLADYLLESQVVSGIACDNSNRKWISTTTNGVYLVSENGDQILENFTSENSILPSNKVWAVACDPNSSSVFFATDAGVVEYNSTSSPAMQNLNDVYAYPNPVRPDYSGWITVTGLMDNTLVKIADAAGNVFFQGRSEGGMITWDGCNAAGERVKTGVYYVFASHGTSSDSSSDSCVTKIMVVN